MQKLENLYYLTYEEDLENKCSVNEASETYTYKITNEKDKIFRDLLSDKEDARKFINKYLELKVPLKENSIELYNSSFITKDYEAKEADIVYKLKDKNIFFLIEHQSKVDLSMPYRIENYSMEIINSIVDKEKMRTKNYLYPKVIPIVLYTGDKKWKTKLKFSDIQEKLEGYEEEDKTYKVVDINSYKNKELLEDELFITKTMALEKSKSTKELVESSIKILIKLQKEKYDKIIQIINIELTRKEGKEKAKEIIDYILKIIEKGSKEDMLDVLDRIERNEKAALRKSKREGKREGIREGIKEGKREGKKEGIVEVAKKLIEEGLDTNLITKVTGLKQEEIIEMK